MLLERALVKKFEAEGTREMLRMPFLTHRSDTLAWRGRGVNAMVVNFIDLLN